MTNRLVGRSPALIVQGFLFWKLRILKSINYTLMNQDYQQQQYQQNFPPKNWLVESILVTLFCCLPLGIVGIVFAAQVNSKFAAGDHAGAISASKDAGKFTKIGFWLGIAQLIIGILWVFFLGGLAILSHRNYF